MKKIFFLGLVGLMGLAPAMAQQKDNPVVMEVGGKQIRQQEMMKDFMPSVGDGLIANGASDAEKRRAMNEYVDLYAIFRAKLMDAHKRGMDTAAILDEELGRYRKDLAAPYLIDSAMESQIMREAYDRNHYAIHAQHILVRVKEDASPEDTLAAYNRALELRKRVLEGENFHAVAAEEVRRLKPDARVAPDEGNLGAFTVFDMVYPFENACYNLQPGDISMPVRSRFGYHIIRLVEKVEYYGKVSIQHFWRRDKNASNEVSLIYDQLAQGASFEVIARQSDDEMSASKGGYILDANMRQLPQEYVTMISRLKEGEISKPFYTQYGWHIIKVLKREEIPPFEKMVPYYRQRMARDMRGNASRKSFAKQARRRYNVVDYTVTPVKEKATKGRKKGKVKKQPVRMMASLDTLTAHLTDRVFYGEWKMVDSLFNDPTVLAEVQGKKYVVRDVAKFISKAQKYETPTSMDFYARCMFSDFLDSIAIAYADSQLEKEHPEFAEVVSDYRKGLLIFNYNEAMIWRKALEDSVGFAKFYERESVKKSLSNPEDSIYFWRTRARVVVFDVKDSQCLGSDKAVKILKKALRKDLGSKEMLDALEAKVDRKHCTESTPVEMKVDLVEKGHQSYLLDDQWEEGIYVEHSGKAYRIVVVQDILAPTIKGQMEARGYYLNGWQNEVERQLNDSLRKEYRVKINHDAVNKIHF